MKSSDKSDLKIIKLHFCFFNNNSLGLFEKDSSLNISLSAKTCTIPEDTVLKCLQRKVFSWSLPEGQSLALDS